MKIPKYANVSISIRIPVRDFVEPLDIEEFSRDHYTDEEIRNDLESWLRNCIWEHIPDNKIKIDFD